MYKRILVPLDGSKLAECALPHAEELAKGCGTEEIILISATEQVRGRTRAPEAQEVYRASDSVGYAMWPLTTVTRPETQKVYRDSDDPRVQIAGSEISITLGKKERQALRYLGRIAKRLKSKRIKVRTEVLLSWPPAETITTYARQNNADIIVMSSHGRSGPSRWAHGSVADKVIRASNIPVLIVRAPGCVPGI